MSVASKSVFAERLKALRLSAGLTQAQLAEKAGISFQAVSRLELGEREPGWNTVLKLANALGVSVAAFNGDADQAEPEPIEPPANEQPPTPPRRRKPKK